MSQRRTSAAILFFLLCLAQPLFAQDAKLVADGKKEGKVVVYGSLEQDIFDDIKKSFEKKTGIAIEYWRASAASMTDRAVTEHRAGKVQSDVLATNSGPMLILLKENIFAKYISPTSKDFPQNLIHAELGPSYRRGVVGIVYNKSVMKPEAAPKSLEDLLKPEYKGKLAMPDPTRGVIAASWPASLYKLMGKDKAEKYIRDLAATKPVIVEGVLNAAERITTGETPLGITYLKYVVAFGQKGAPLDYVRLEKMLGHGHYVGLDNKAAHPSAGKAFIDFFLSEESMKLMARMGEVVSRKGIYPPLADADKIQVIEMDELDTAAFAEKRKEYAKLFLQ
ncbi:MAG TPA: extracellular solute-binding protein [Candidatus Binatia bacterium]